MKHLVICPGLSSPWYPKYVPCYDLLREQAGLRGYKPVVVVYPGQVSADGSTKGKLSPHKAVSEIEELLCSLEESQTPYRLMGISFGCCVALASAARLQSTLYLEKIVTWGAIPHWYFWTSFGCGTRNENLGMGTTFIESPEQFYMELIPVEHLVKEPSISINIAYGSNDAHVPSEFSNYLQRVCKGSGGQSHTFTLVEGCGHNVSKEDKNWQDYIDVVFS